MSDTRWLSNLGTAIIVGSGALTYAKLLGVAGFQVQTTFALLKYAGTGSVLLGTFTALTPIVLGLGAWALNLWLVTRYVVTGGKGPEVDGVLISILVFINLVALLIEPRPYLAILVGISLGVATAFLFHHATRLLVKIGLYRHGRPDRYVSMRKRHKRAARSLLVLRIYAGLIIGVIAVFSAFGSDPWIPAESVKLSGQGGPITGYFVATDGGDSIILVDSPRGVVRISNSDVTSRTMCNPYYGYLDSVRPLFSSVVIPTLEYGHCPRRKYVP